MVEENFQEKQRNPYTPWLVVLSFVAPVVMAFVVFYFVEITSFTNKGEILNPIVDIASLKLTDESGEIIPRDTLTYKWRLISFVGADCDEACNKILHASRQIHKTLGKNRNRVLRVIVHLEPASEALKDLIAAEYPNTLTMYGDEKAINTAFGDTSKLDENEVYIMDPRGNIMMRFTQDQPKKDFLHDLKKLLKASQIG